VIIVADKIYKFKIYKLNMDTDELTSVTNIEFTGIDRVSVDAKNKSDYYPVADGNPIWVNMGPEYIKIRFQATYEGYEPNLLEPNLFLKCSDADLPEFDMDTGYWRIMSCDAKKDAKTSNIIIFNIEASLYMDDQPSFIS
jgi:hypothetical protein